MVDIGAALLFLLVFPFTFFRVMRPGQFFANCFKVLFGGSTWVGYASGVPVGSLPPIRPGVIQPYNILAGYDPSAR